MKKYIRSCISFIFLSFLLNISGYSQYQTEGVIEYSTAAFLTDSMQLEKPYWREFTKIWFKDSSIVYELRINYETRDETPAGTAVKRSYPVWRYVYLDLRTMKCQDYHSFNDTAMPFCNYLLKPDDPIAIWKFYAAKKLSDSNKLIKISDTVINNTIFKRIKKFYNAPARYYSVYYLNCNARRNMFDLDKSLNELFPNCKTMKVETLDFNGKVRTITEYKILSDKLSTSEEAIFKQWQKNALKIKLPVLSYAEARKNFIAADYNHENPTITIVPSNELQPAKSNIKPDDVKEWLQRSTNPLTPHKNEIIKKVLENALFDKMYVELHHDKENLIIIPFKKEYFSQHAKNKNAAPLQYLLLVENSKGEIRRGDIVLFFAKDQNLMALPKNSFHYFFNGGSLSVDGTFTLISLGDVKQYEMDFKNWGKTEFRLWHQKNWQNEKSSHRADWYLSTTIYHENGTISQQEKVLGATSTSCPPNFVCDKATQ